MPKNKFTGRWRIDWMEVWGLEAMDLLGPVFIHFDDEGFGDFRFITVTGHMHCDYQEKDGKPGVEFSWEGNDEMDPATGRGWATLESDGGLKGRMHIHLGDHSAFTATRMKATVKVAGKALRKRT
jgi:hypothetical protein